MTREVFVASVGGRSLDFEIERADAPKFVALVLGTQGEARADALAGGFAARRGTVVRADLPADIRDAAEVQRLTESIVLFTRTQEGMGLPVCLAAVGGAAPLVFRMVTEGEPGASVVTADAHLRGMRSLLAGVEAPTLLLFEGGPLRGLRQHVAARRIAGPSTAMTAEVGEFDAILGRWVVNPRTLIAAAQPSTLRRVAPVAAAAAFVVGTAGGVLADPFTGGVGIAHAQVTRGDTSSPSASSDAGKTDKTDKWAQRGVSTMSGDGKVKAKATGSQTAIDAQGLKYFINTNITFSTTSSASAAMSEASFQNAVPASTLNGGTTQSTLNDAFDGYQGLWTDISGQPLTTAPTTGSTAGSFYNKLGPATVDAACTGGKQVVFPVQTVTKDGSNPINVQRSVFVPSNDQFARWVQTFHNTNATDQKITMAVTTNLGSDSNTKIVTTSGGTTTVGTADTWATTFQNWSGTTSSDPRLGHVFAGTGATQQLSAVHFADGDDNPFWGYTFTVPAGGTVAIVNYVTAQPTKAAAASKSAELASNQNANQFACMTDTTKTEVANFVAVKPAPAPEPIFIAPRFTG